MFYRKCWFDLFKEQFISLLNFCQKNFVQLFCPNVWNCHSLYTAFSSNVGAWGTCMWAFMYQKFYLRKLTSREIIGNFQRRISWNSNQGRGSGGVEFFTHTLRFYFDWLIDYIVLYAVSAIFWPYNGGVFFILRVRRKKWYHCMLSTIKLYAYDIVKSFKNKP